MDASLITHDTDHLSPQDVRVEDVPTGSAEPLVEGYRELPTRYLGVKYAASRLAAGVGLIVLAPVFGIVAAAIRWKLGSGVLYRQSRIGRHGETFVILKFRTMAPDRRQGRSPVAEDRRQTHKSDQDPRHHPLGRFLRRTSIDELPQLWNVVRGEMTLIGPRPELTEVAERYGFRDHPRHVLLPGITGLWQVSEHRAEPLHEHIHVDTDYVQRVSLRLDLRIIAQSFALILRPTGR